MLVMLMINIDGDVFHLKYKSKMLKFVFQVFYLNKDTCTNASSTVSDKRSCPFNTDMNKYFSNEVDR